MASIFATVSDSLMPKCPICHDNWASAFLSSSPAFQIWLWTCRQPNKTPEPMVSITVSPLSRLDDFWSRMAQLRMLGR